MWFGKPEQGYWVSLLQRTGAVGHLDLKFRNSGGDAGSDTEAASPEARRFTIHPLRISSCPSAGLARASRRSPYLHGKGAGRSCRQCTYLLGPADEASLALISDVSQQTPPSADIARKHDGQGMCSRLTYLSAPRFAHAAPDGVPTWVR